MTNIDLTVRAAIASSLIAAFVHAPAYGATAEGPAPADGAAPAADADSGDSLESVIVTGTRETNIKARDSAAPIDVLPATALQATGATDLRDALERVLPSLNHAAFAGDYGALTDTVQLRGLSPNHVLILINGKRRHTTANIYTAGGPLQGSAPVDLDLIPLSAIDHIEVLRDGAAQYGSDAIAGVINIILKSANHGGTATANVGNYYDGGGFTAGGSGDIGTSLGDDGFIHLGGDYRHHNHSVRSGADTRTSAYRRSSPACTRRAFRLRQPSMKMTSPPRWASGETAFLDGTGIYRLPTVVTRTDSA